MSFDVLAVTDKLAWLAVFPHFDVLGFDGESFHRNRRPEKYSIVVELEKGCVLESYPTAESYSKLDRPEVVAALRSSIGLAHRFGQRRLDGDAGTALWSADFRHVLAESDAGLLHSRDGGVTYQPVEPARTRSTSRRGRIELVDGDSTLLYGRCTEPAGQDGGSACPSQQYELVSRSLDGDPAAPATVLRPLGEEGSLLGVAADGRLLVAEPDRGPGCLGRFDRTTRTTKTTCPAVTVFSTPEHSPSGRYSSGAWEDRKGLHEALFDMENAGAIVQNIPTGLGVQRIDDAGGMILHETKEEGGPMVTFRSSLGKPPRRLAGSQTLGLDTEHGRVILSAAVGKDAGTPIKPGVCKLVHTVPHPQVAVDRK